jgi:cell fate regulator YaaT (PSP1 superfamily)
VRFPQGGKVYWFDPAAVTFAAGDPVIVETARGTELGFVSIANRKVSASGIVQPLKPVIRKASEADIAHDADNRRRADAAIRICRAKVEKHGLDMKLVGAQYTFDNSKLIFYFTAAQRVDFRELVKDLAAEFRTRIELRQIGIRDEAKMLGGYGVCGRRLCCSYFLPNFAQVSVRMAKEQGLSLNSSKISGNCGRLMCCLRFEQSTYEKELAAMPAPGSVVNTPDGRGTVTETRPVGEMLKVRLDEKTDQPPKVYSLTDVTVISRAEFRNEGPDDDADLPEQ